MLSNWPLVRERKILASGKQMNFCPRGVQILETALFAWRVVGQFGLSKLYSKVVTPAKAGVQKVLSWIPALGPLWGFRPGPVQPGLGRNDERAPEIPLSGKPGELTYNRLAG